MSTPPIPASPSVPPPASCDTAAPAAGRARPAALSHLHCVDQILALMQEAVLLVGLDGTVLEWSPGAERLYGWSAGETVGRRYYEFMAPADAAVFAQYRDMVLTEGAITRVSERATRSGRTILTEASITAVRDPQGVPVAMLAVARDITAHHESVERLQAVQRQLAYVLEGSNDGFWDWDVPRGQVETSARVASMLGYGRDDVPAALADWAARIHPQDRAEARSQALEHLDGHADQLAVEVRVQDGRGDWRWLLVRGKVVERDARQRPVRVAGTCTDVSARKASEAALEDSRRRLGEMNEQLLLAHAELLAHAQADPLTGLPNRRTIVDAATAEFQRAITMGGAMAIALVEVDHFTAVNDTHGHPAGDRALVHVADTLRRRMRGREHIGRYGGEEFLVIFPEATLEAAWQAAERLCEVVKAAPVRLDAGDLALTVSIGLAALPCPNLARLVALADRALDEARRAGRDCVRWRVESDEA